MRLVNLSQFRNYLRPPHLTWQSKKSRNRAFQFLNNEKVRSPRGQRLNIGSGSRRLDTETLNLDLLACEEVDIQGDLLHLPIKDKIVETIVCTGVLEHVSDPHEAVEEIYRVLKLGEECSWRYPSCKQSMPHQQIFAVGRQMEYGN